jgi:hypothetical protein
MQVEYTGHTAVDSLLVWLPACTGVDKKVLVVRGVLVQKVAGTYLHFLFPTAVVSAAELADMLVVVFEVVVACMYHLHGTGERTVPGSAVAVRMLAESMRSVKYLVLWVVQCIFFQCPALLV